MYTIDMHVDTGWKSTKYGALDLRKDLSQEGNRDVDFPRMRKGGLIEAVHVLYLPNSWQDRLGPDASYKQVLWQAKWLKACGVRKLALEGLRLLGGDIRRIKELQGLGVVYITLVHKRSVHVESATGARLDPVIDDFARDAIKEMSKLGVIVDVSHASTKVMDYLHNYGYILGHAPYTRPIFIASHSGCAHLMSCSRNLQTEHLSTLNFIGIPFAASMIGRNASNIVKHVDYIVQESGEISGVGIGSDLDGAVMAKGAEDVSRWADVVIEPLVKQGYTYKDIHAIVGGNAERLFDDARHSSAKARESL